MPVSGTSTDMIPDSHEYVECTSGVYSGDEHADYHLIPLIIFHRMSLTVEKLSTFKVNSSEDEDVLHDR